MELYYNTAHKTNCGMLIGTFADRESAENVYNTLRDSGYRESDIYLIMTEETRKKYFPGDAVRIEMIRKSSITEIIAYFMNNDVAGITGAVESSLVIPKLEIMIAGPLVTQLNEAENTLAKSLTEILVNLGIPENLTRRYEDEIKNGNVMMGVHPRNEQETLYFEKNWQGNYGREIYRIC